MAGLPGGVIGACLTPFLPGGGVDGPALEREIDFMAGHCDAISILGAEVTEYRLLSEADRRRWLRDGIAAVDGRTPVLAGASSPRIGEVATMAEIAAHAGADFLQVLIPRRPWGPEAGTAELVAYFEAVVGASPLPVVAYHNPTCGSDPPPGAVVEICAMDGVVGLKESSRDMSRIGRLAAEVDVAGRARYLTTMQPMLATLLQGGSGAMMPAPATYLGARLMTAFRAGDIDGARAVQARFAEFPGRWSSYGLTPVMKCALRHLGIEVGDAGAPFATVSDEDAAAIGDFLAQAGVPSPAPTPARFSE